MSDRYDTRRRRPLYGPAPSSRRSTLGYWVPLVLTITVATAGIVAWAWSERREDDEEDYSADERPDYPGGVRDAEEESFVSRVSGAVRRSPSPQQFFDSAGRQISAGVAAAGAVVGSALGSIQEEHGSRSSASVRGGENARQREENGFSDHERWSEEAVSRRSQGEKTATSSSRRRGPKRSVAIVVSAETHHDFEHEEEDGFLTEHASILSHVPHQFDSTTTNLFVLIYAPHVTTLPKSTLETHDAESPPHEAARTRALDALQTQALSLTSAPERIMPFTTPTGYIHILRHLAPSLVYVSDSAALSGLEGENIAGLRGWVGQVVVVIGDEGHGGLVDTETETEDEWRSRGKAPATTQDRKWWENSEIVGLGKGVEIVDAERVGDDWRKRVGGSE